MGTDLPMETPGSRTMFAILHADGSIYGSGKSAATLFKTQGAAQNKARREGDAVITVTISLRVEPLYIRKKAL